MASLPSFHSADFQGEITLDQVIPEVSAIFAPLPPDLRPELVAALAGRGVQRLYSHQAYAAVRKGRHLVVVTPTASGKTLCYNLPVLQRLLENPDKRALYLYPTKALAQDQLAELSALKHGLPIELRADTYDGDTPPGHRGTIALPTTRPSRFDRGCRPPSRLAGVDHHRGHARIDRPRAPGGVEAARPFSSAEHRRGGAKANARPSA